MDGLRGFLTASPTLNYDKNGRAFLRLDWGRKQWTKHADGSFTEAGTEYGTALYGGADADELFRRLRKGDTIIAVGTTRHFDYTGKDGQPASKPVFDAKHLGHDASRTLYAVARIPRALAAEWRHTQTLVTADFDQRAHKLGTPTETALDDPASRSQGTSVPDIPKQVAVPSPFDRPGV